MFPDVSDAFWGWTNPVIYRIVTPTLVDYEVEQLLAAARTVDGIMEPLTPQRLALKPEGMRNWKWWRLWTSGTLNNGDIVVDPEGKQFQVQERSDWRQGGYNEYEVTEKPT